VWRQSPLRAWLSEVLGHAHVPGRGRPAPARPEAPPDSPAARREALRKLESLFESGVLTAEQFAAERDRLLGR
jgi:Short C-terminal domain